MLRVLSPAEQSCLTLDAQALIYKYRSRKWLSPQQLEELITESVNIARIRHVPTDEQIVGTVLHHMGDDAANGLVAGPAGNGPDSENLLS